MAYEPKLIEVLKEIRGTGAPGDIPEDGIYHDIILKETDSDDVTARLAPGMYGSMQIMHGYIDELVPIKDELIALEAMADELHSLYMDKATLDSLYADKVTLDSIYTDKVTLDSLYNDKVTLDSLYADKATLDSLFADKATLDSLFTDKVMLDSLYADKAILDSLYADKTILDSLYADKSKLDSLFADKVTLDSLYSDKSILDSLYGDKATLDSLFADKAILDSIYADKATLDSLYADKTTLDRLHTSIDNIDTVEASILNVDAVGDDIDNVNAVADGLADVNNYADTYYGGLATAPTIGSHPSLSVGDMYYDTALDELRVYDNGDTWKSAGSTVNGVDKSEQFKVGTASGIYDGVSLNTFPMVNGYDAGFVTVFRNGFALAAEDIDISSGTNVVLLEDANTTDVVYALAFGAFVLVDHYTKAEVDTQFAAYTTARNQSVGNINNPLLDLPLNNNLSMKQGVGSVTFARTTTATYIDRYGVLQYAGIDEARFEKDGLLIEGGGTNLCLYSNDLSQSNYNKARCSHSVDTTTTPDGISLANKITEDGTVSNTHEAYQTVTLNAVDHTFNLYIKKGNKQYSGFRFYNGSVTTQVVVDLDAGTIFSGTATIESEIDDWYKISITDTSVVGGTCYIYATLASDAGAISYDGDGSSYTYFAFLQLEELPFASSYIPTTTTAVTRGADVCEVTYENNFPSQTEEISILNDISILGYKGDQTQRVWRFNGLVSAQMRITQANRVGVYYGNTNTNVNVDTLQTMNRLGMVYNKSTVYGYGNGILDNSVSMTAPTGTLSTFTLGSETNGANSLYGHIKNFRIYDKALTSTEVALS